MLARVAERSSGLPPHMQEIMKQRRGVWLAEFFWEKQVAQSSDQRSRSTISNFHTVAINCDLRIVLCNTLGVIPFSYNGGDLEHLPKAESVETHDAVAKLFSVREMCHVWLLAESATGCNYQKLLRLDNQKCRLDTLPHDALEELFARVAVDDRFALKLAGSAALRAAAPPRTKTSV